jgi:hypothetical protein
MYVVDGFCSVEVAPLPRFQNQLVGLPVLRSENCTTIGEQPEVTLAEKSAVVCALAKRGRNTVSPTHSNACKYRFIIERLV